VIIPSRIRETCNGIPELHAWLDELPRIVDDLQRRWSVSLGPPLDGDDVSCSWIARGTRRDGTAVMLKVGMPHFEGQHEIPGLRFWKLA
jgi:hypothetical protein